MDTFRTCSLCEIRCWSLACWLSSTLSDKSCNSSYLRRSSSRADVYGSAILRKGSWTFRFREAPKTSAPFKYYGQHTFHRSQTLGSYQRVLLPPVKICIWHVSGKASSSVRFGLGVYRKLKIQRFTTATYDLKKVCIPQSFRQTIPFYNPLG